MRTLVAVLLLSACAFAQGLGGTAGMGGAAGVGGGASGGGGGAPVVTLLTTTYCHGTSTTTTGACALSSTSTAGALVKALFGYDDNAGAAPTSVVCDDAGNTALTLESSTAPAHSAGSLWQAEYSAVVAGTCSHVTVTWASSFNTYQLVVIQITGLATGAFDVGSYLLSSGDSNFSSGATGAIAGANEVAIGFSTSTVAGQVWTDGGGYTSLTTQNDGTLAVHVTYKVVSSGAQTYSGTLGTVSFVRTSVGVNK